jgi:hypothetical protein
MQPSEMSCARKEMISNMRNEDVTGRVHTHLLVGLAFGMSLSLPVGGLGSVYYQGEYLSLQFYVKLP